MAVSAVVIARDDVSEEDVYNFVYTIFENADSIAASHDKGKELDLSLPPVSPTCLIIPAPPSTSLRRALRCPPSKASVKIA